MSDLAGITEVRTSHGSVLAVSLNDGVIRHVTDAALGAGFIPLMLYRAPRHRGLGVLFSPLVPAQPLAVAGLSHASSVMIARVHVGQAPEEVALTDRVTGCFWCAEPLTPDGTGTVCIDRHALGPWETFQLEAAEAADHVSGDDPADARIAAIRRHVSALTSAPAFLALLEEGGADADALLAIAPLVSRSDLDWLGRAAVHSPSALDHLAALMPDDVWVKEAIPRLRSDGHGESFPTEQTVETEMGRVAVSGLDGEATSFGQALNAAARRSVAPTEDLCILAVPRRDGLYLLDWLAYHRAIGIDHAILYSAGDEDASDQVLRLLAQHGLITWVRMSVASRIDVRAQAFAHALQMGTACLRFRYALLISVDEYLVFDRTRYDSIADYAAWQSSQGADIIALSRLAFGSNGAGRRNDGPVFERFVGRTSVASPSRWSMVRPSLAVHASDGIVVIPKGLPLTLVDGSADGDVWINQYVFKSIDEFAVQAVYESTDTAGIRRFLDHLSNVDIVVDERMKVYAQGMGDELARLKALPGMDAALRAVHRSYDERLAHLRAQMRSDPGFAAAGSAERAFCELLLGQTHPLAMGG